MGATNLGSIGEAFVDIRANLDTLQRDLNKVGTMVAKAGAKIRGIGRTTTTYITLPLVAAGVAAVKTASDVQEMENLFAVTFGKASKDVADWAAVMGKQMNRSRYELMRTAADFAAFLKPLGVADKQIAPMSKALAGLVTDVSSFRNMTEEEVFTRLFSGLAGETEAVRRLGIDIGQAAIDQELLNLGIHKTQLEATQGEKVLARYSLIMKQTKDAQGDAARTAASFENQTRGLMATVKDIAVAIGERLLPVATMLVGKLRELGQKFLNLSSTTQSGIIAIVGFTAVLGPALVALGLLLQGVGFAIRGFALFGPVLRFAWTAIKGFVIASQAALVAFTSLFATLPGLIITALAGVVGGLFIFRRTIVGFFEGLVLAIKDAFVAGFNNKVVIPFQNALNALSRMFVKFGPEFAGLASAMHVDVNDVIDNSFTDDMKQVISTAVESGKQEFDSFKTSASGAIDYIKGKVVTLKDTVMGYLPDLSLSDFNLDNVGSQFDDLLNKFSDLSYNIDNLPDKSGTATDQVSDDMKNLGQTIQSSMENNLTDAATMFQSFGNAARNIIQTIISEILRLAVIKPLVGGILGGLGLPGFAMGGNIAAGTAAVIGEHGPELFVPKVNGQIVPNHRVNFGKDMGGGAGGIAQTFNFPIVFPPQLEAYIRNVAGPAGREAAVGVLSGARGRI